MNQKIDNTASAWLSPVQLWSLKRFRHGFATLICAVIVIADPAAAWQAIVFSLNSLLLISPVMLAGLLLTASMLASNSIQLLSASFQGRELSMIVWASLIGAVTPVCGATVLPLVAGLLIARVPLAPIMAFWLASPVTDPAMLSLTAATLGWPLAIGKTLAACGAGLSGGIVTWLFTRSGGLTEPLRQSGYVQEMSQGACHAELPLLWRFWQEAARRKIFSGNMISSAKLMIVWLGLAFVAEYYMQSYLPMDWLQSWFGKDAAYAVPLAALIGAPIYLDGLCCFAIGTQPDGRRYAAGCGAQLSGRRRYCQCLGCVTCICVSAWPGVHALSDPGSVCSNAGRTGRWIFLIIA